MPPPFKTLSADVGSKGVVLTLYISAALYVCPPLFFSPHFPFFLPDLMAKAG